MTLRSFVNARYNPNSDINRLLLTENIECAFEPAIDEDDDGSITIKSAYAWIKLELLSRSRMKILLEAMEGNTNSEWFKSSDFGAHLGLSIQNGVLMINAGAETSDETMVTQWRIPVIYCIEAFRQAVNSGTSEVC